ncbi:MAG TPA: MlaD family protein [Acetobacteraceae bacterium]|nr:MlaD family protein [Acetobacteraceae bacterium]
MPDDDIVDRPKAGRPPGPEPLPQAHRRKTRWPGWVWVIPLAALAFGIWLGVQYLAGGSGDVTVRFAGAEGLTAGAPVRYRGVTVGHVKAIDLGEDLHHVRVALGIDGPVSEHIGAGTEFWIEQPKLVNGQIRSLMAGSYVDVEPVDGAHKTVFDGLEAPPVLPADQPGRRFILTAGDASGLSQGAPVLYKGVAVGRVLGLRLDKSKKQVEIYVFVKAKDTDLVRQDTSFWRAGGVSVSMAQGLDVTLPPLRTVLSGAIAFETPEVFAGPPAGTDASFPLHSSRATAEAAAGGPAFSYFIEFPEGVGGLVGGAPVTLGGRQVGRVENIGLPTAKKGGKFSTPVEISINALALDLRAGASKTRKELQKKLNQKLAKLIENGLRAKVSAGGLLSGSSVKLAIVSGAPPAGLDEEHKPPAIPAAAPGKTS